jgi:hypothetical protein
VASALALAPGTTSGLTITIKGTCVEAVDPVPGGVTLQGDLPGDGLEAPTSSSDPVLGISGTGVTLNNLTISGGVNALLGHSGAAFTGNNLAIEGASNADLYLAGARAELTNSTIENSANYGVESGFGAVLFMNGGLVQNNGWGVDAFNNGVIDLYGGVLVQNNPLGGGIASEGGAIELYSGTVQNNADGQNAGLYVQHGGNLRIDGATASVANNGWDGVGVFEAATATIVNGANVANNARNGVFLYAGGTASLYNGSVVQSNTADGIHIEVGNVNVGNGATGGVTIQNNGTNGIYVQSNSVAGFSSSGNQIINNKGFGIFCAKPPGDPLIIGTVGTVSGNVLGQNNCSVAGN